MFEFKSGMVLCYTACSCPQSDRIGVCLTPTLPSSTPISTIQTPQLLLVVQPLNFHPRVLIMASSDKEGEILPPYVTNYHFVNSNNSLISFYDLPLHFSDHDVIVDGETSVSILLGSTDGSPQSVYEEVIGWRYDISVAVPEIYVFSKTKKWIKLEKPRESYENIMKSILIVVRFLHFAKRSAEASRDEILSHLIKTLSSYDVVEPLETCLKDHMTIIRSAVANDKDLAKSKYIEVLLAEMENPERRETLFEEKKETKKSEFIVSDDEMGNDDDFDEEAEGLFDSVCAFCDDGGDLLVCEGLCIRSFHPTIEAGVNARCESIGFENAAQYEGIGTFLCDNCKYQRHQCFVCGKLGSSDKSSAIEVFPCVSATCGHFYHPECVAKLLYPSDETQAKKLVSGIAAGESFTCPIHKCHYCDQGEDKDVHELQFAVCRRCPLSYHRKCLPKEIAFEPSADGTVHQRAWDDLYPKRILMYCMKHEIISSIMTPKRDHLLFSSIVRKRNQEGIRTEIMSERSSNAMGNYKELDIGKTARELGKSSGMHGKRSSFEEQRSISISISICFHFLFFALFLCTIHVYLCAFFF